MSETRVGRQTPTISVTVSYTETKGNEVIELYNSIADEARFWQEQLIMISW